MAKKRNLVVACCLALAVSWLTPWGAWADIYRWTDSAGVLHFSNERPPAGARVAERIREERYNPEADRVRLEEERRLRLAYRWLDVQELWARTGAGCDPYVDPWEWTR
jgi:hypothetical protein